MKRILVISPHPDDEAIGCGGTISKHVAEGDKVDVIFLTSGEKGGHGKPELETIIIREQEAKDAAKILALSNVEFWKQPDGKLKVTTANVKCLRTKIEISKPAIIYVPHNKEDHPDHRAAAFLVKRAVNQLSGDVKNPDVWMYEVWTPLQQMDQIVDITLHLETKRLAILAHKSQCEALKFDEAILGLNRYRGEMHSWPGGEYAEVFKRMNFKI